LWTSFRQTYSSCSMSATPKCHQPIHNTTLRWRSSTKQSRSSCNLLWMTLHWTGRPSYWHWQSAITPVTTLRSPPHHLNCYSEKTSDWHNFLMKTYHSCTMVKLLRLNVSICCKG
jgi:hypothetical protein